MEYYPVGSMDSVNDMNYGIPSLIPYSSLNADNWNLKNYKKTIVFKKMLENSRLLDSIGHCNAGLITGLDKVLMFSEKDLKDLPFEQEILLPVLRANSDLMKSFIQSIASLKSGGYYQYSSNILNRCPIPSATPAQQKPIIALVDKVLAAKGANRDADTTADEHKIDELVYALYGLTEAEIAVIEEK